MKMMMAVYMVRTDTGPIQVLSMSGHFSLYLAEKA